MFQEDTMYAPNWGRIAAVWAVLAASFPCGTLKLAAQAVPAVTLDEAISRARANEPAFAAALAQSRIAELDRSIARAALLPTAVVHNQFVYTQPAHGSTGSANASAANAAITSAPRFIANNTVHEYVSQGVASETLGVQQIAAVARASAAAAVAKAELEIARRGLVATVVNLFYTALSADRRVAIAQRAEDEAASFVKLTGQREQARESAHADVVKAQLLEQQRQRELQNARVEAQKARLELGVLLFADPRSPFALADPPAAALASRADIEAAATRSNPELQSALASLRASNLGVTSAVAAYLPELGVSVAYGIDAPQFAVHAPDGVKNLGYSATATVDIPVWDWLSTQHRVKQAQIQRDVAKVTLSATQRRLIAQLDESYAEAETAQSQLASLDLSVKTAEESLKLTRLRYTAGEATVLEVVDAQTSFTAAETAREDGAIRFQAAAANLQLLTGTI
jgi:outer membrane protein TolC